LQGPAGGGDIAQAYVAASLNNAKDKGELKDFMKRLEQPTPNPAGPPSIAAGLGLAGSEPALDQGVPKAKPAAGALDQLGGYLGGILGIDEGDAGAPVSAPPAWGSVVAQLDFADGSAELPAAADDALGRALAAARAADGRLRIVAPPGDAVLGADRARAVAASLVRLGAPADILETVTGGTGDAVQIHLVPPTAS
jgi:hypothetical protein